MWDKSLRLILVSQLEHISWMVWYFWPSCVIFVVGDINSWYCYVVRVLIQTVLLGDDHSASALSIGWPSHPTSPTRSTESAGAQNPRCHVYWYPGFCTFLLNYIIRGYQFSVCLAHSESSRSAWFSVVRCDSSHSRIKTALCLINMVGFC